MTDFLVKIKKNPPKKHPAFDLFMKYDIAKIAEQIGYSRAWIINVMYGHQKPSKKCNDAIAAMVAKIKRAEAARAARQEGVIS